jgi:uncharacterized protein (DUF2267 family)
VAMTGLDVFDRTVHATNIWLKEVMEELQWDNRHRAYEALRGTLHALRNQLTVEEATDLGAQLPMLVRGLYYEGWNPSKTPIKERRKEDFLHHVQEAFRTTAAPPDIDPEPVVRAVFRVMSQHVTEGEINDVRSSLPEALKDFWPAPSAA